MTAPPNLILPEGAKIVSSNVVYATGVCAGPNICVSPSTIVRSCVPTLSHNIGPPTIYRPPISERRVIAHLPTTESSGGHTSTDNSHMTNRMTSPFGSIPPSFTINRGSSAWSQRSGCQSFLHLDFAKLESSHSGDVVLDGPGVTVGDVELTHSGRRKVSFIFDRSACIDMSVKLPGQRTLLLLSDSGLPPPSVPTPSDMTPDSRTSGTPDLPTSHSPERRLSSQKGGNSSISDVPRVRSDFSDPPSSQAQGASPLIHATCKTHDSSETKPLQSLPETPTLGSTEDKPEALLVLPPYDPSCGTNQIFPSEACQTPFFWAESASGIDVAKSVSACEVNEIEKEDAPLSEAEERYAESDEEVVSDATAASTPATGPTTGTWSPDQGPRRPECGMASGFSFGALEGSIIVLTRDGANAEAQIDQHLPREEVGCDKSDASRNSMCGSSSLTSRSQEIASADTLGAPPSNPRPQNASTHKVSSLAITDSSGEVESSDVCSIPQSPSCLNPGDSARNLYNSDSRRQSLIGEAVGASNMRLFTSSRWDVSTEEESDQRCCLESWRQIVKDAAASSASSSDTAREYSRMTECAALEQHPRGHTRWIILDLVSRRTGLLLFLHENFHVSQPRQLRSQDRAYSEPVSLGFAADEAGESAPDPIRRTRSNSSRDDEGEAELPVEMSRNVEKSYGPVSAIGLLPVCGDNNPAAEPEEFVGDDAGKEEHDYWQQDDTQVTEDAISAARTPSAILSPSHGDRMPAPSMGTATDCENEDEEGSPTIKLEADELRIVAEGRNNTESSHAAQSRSRSRSHSGEIAVCLPALEDRPSTFGALSNGLASDPVQADKVPSPQTQEGSDHASNSSQSPREGIVGDEVAQFSGPEAAVDSAKQTAAENLAAEKGNGRQPADRREESGATFSEVDNPAEAQPNGDAESKAADAQGEAIEKSSDNDASHIDCESNLEGAEPPNNYAPVDSMRESATEKEVRENRDYSDVEPESDNHVAIERKSAGHANGGSETVDHHEEEIVNEQPINTVQELEPGAMDEQIEGAGTPPQPDGEVEENDPPSAPNAKIPGAECHDDNEAEEGEGQGVPLDEACVTKSDTCPPKEEDTSLNTAAAEGSEVALDISAKSGRGCQQDESEEVEEYGSQAIEIFNARLLEVCSDLGNSLLCEVPDSSMTPEDVLDFQAKLLQACDDMVGTRGMPEDEGCQINVEVDSCPHEASEGLGVDGGLDPEINLRSLNSHSRMQSSRSVVEEMVQGEVEASVAVQSELDAEALLKKDPIPCWHESAVVLARGAAEEDNTDTLLQCTEARTSETDECGGMCEGSSEDNIGRAACPQMADATRDVSAVATNSVQLATASTKQRLSSCECAAQPLKQRNISPYQRRVTSVSSYVASPGIFCQDPFSYRDSVEGKKTYLKDDASSWSDVPDAQSIHFLLQSACNPQDGLISTRSYGGFNEGGRMTRCGGVPSFRRLQGPQVSPSEPTKARGDLPEGAHKDRRAVSSAIPLMFSCQNRTTVQGWVSAKYGTMIYANLPRAESNETPRAQQLLFRLKKEIDKDVNPVTKSFVQ